VSDEAKAEVADELRPEYEEAELKQLLTNGVRGKYVERFRIAAALPTEEAVNDALRKLLAVGYASQAS
jgi:hypothetical protein